MRRIEVSSATESTEIDKTHSTSHLQLPRCQDHYRQDIYSEQERAQRIKKIDHRKRREEIEIGS